MAGFYVLSTEYINKHDSGGLIYVVNIWGGHLFKDILCSDYVNVYLDSCNSKKK